MLLRTDDHTRAHEAHVSNDFVCSETVSIDEVGADKTAGSSKTSLAVDGDALALDGNHLVGKVDELLDKAERRAGAIIKDHIQMLDAKRLEVGCRVELRVETHNEANAALDKVGEDVLEGLGNGGVAVQRR